MRHHSSCLASAHGTVAGQDVLARFHGSLATSTIDFLTQFVAEPLAVGLRSDIGGELGYVAVECCQPFGCTEFWRLDGSLIAVVPGRVAMVGIHKAGEDETANQTSEAGPRNAAHRREYLLV